MQSGLFTRAPLDGLTLRPASALRGYQQEAVSSAFREWETRRSTLIVLPTGTGKSVVGAHVAHQAQGRVLWLAMRDFLLQQASGHLERATGEYVSLEKAQWYSTDSRIVVGSVQTMRGDRLRRHAPDDFGTIIIDEAHHAPAKSVRAILDHFAKAKVLGLTATPGRADEIGMWTVFESVAFRRDIDWAVSEGFFVPPMPRARYIEGIDLTLVKTTAGDLNLGGLEEQIARNAGAIAQLVAEECGARQTIVYVPGVASAKSVAATLCELGKTAEEADAETPEIDRMNILERFRLRQTQYLVNVGLYTEGLDLPLCDAIAIARPTKSQTMYQQMAGRGGRPAPGIGELATAAERVAAIAASSKPNFLLLDITGRAGAHSLVNAADAMSGKDLPTRELVRKMIQDGEPGTLAELEAKAEQMLAVEKAKANALKHAEEQRALANQAAIAKSAAAARIKAQRGTWDVFSNLGCAALPDGIAPSRDKQPATVGDVEWLKENRLPWVGQTHANVQALQRQARDWRRTAMATFRQRAVLARAQAPVNLTFAQASSIIDALAKNGWKPLPGEAIEKIANRIAKAPSIHRADDADINWP